MPNSYRADKVTSHRRRLAFSVDAPLTARRRAVAPFQTRELRFSRYYELLHRDFQHMLCPTRAAIPSKECTEKTSDTPAQLREMNHEVQYRANERT